jgi:cyclohexa-1,5-dienecarbonyl-CoA hydratase
LADVLLKLRELSPSSLRMTRRALAIGDEYDFDKSLKKVEDLYLDQLMKTEDANEGLRSFMEKRKPEWKSK